MVATVEDTAAKGVRLRREHIDDYRGMESNSVRFRQFPQKKNSTAFCSRRSPMR